MLAIFLSWSMILDNYLGVKSQKRLLLLGNPNWDKGYSISSYEIIIWYPLDQKWTYIRKGHWKIWLPWAHLCCRVRVIQWHTKPAVVDGIVWASARCFTPALCLDPESLSRESVHKSAPCLEAESLSHNPVYSCSSMTPLTPWSSYWYP